MSQPTSGNAPGFQTTVEGEDAQVWWSGRHGQNQVATQAVTVDKAATDPGNSPATTLRAGHVMAVADASGKALPYDPDANDGTQVPRGVLEQSLDMLQAGVATDRFTQLMVHGLVKENELVGLDERARQQLAGNFKFDAGAAAGVGNLMHPRGVYRKDSNYTVKASETGILFIATAAVDFTLPTKANGLAFRFLQLADADMSIVGSGDILTVGDAVANSVAFSTASEKIGSHVLVECLYVGTSTLKWLVTNLGGTTATVTAGG